MQNAQQEKHHSTVMILQNLTWAIGALLDLSCSSIMPLRRITKKQKKTQKNKKKENLPLEAAPAGLKRVLTFGMIPHITQERRAENNIHHTGRIEGIVVDAEKMWGDDWPFGCLPDNVCLSGLQGGRGGEGAAGGRAKRGCRVPARCRSDVMTSAPRFSSSLQPVKLNR